MSRVCFCETNMGTQVFQAVCNGQLHESAVYIVSDIFAHESYCSKNTQAISHSDECLLVRRRALERLYESVQAPAGNHLSWLLC